MTHTMEISAPLDISTHRELIMSMLEYNPTPKVAAKNDSADTMMDFALVSTASQTASFFSMPAVRFLRNLVVIRIA